MKKVSLATAKARLSALVDEAEHKGRRILILRHGKPSAAIVSVSVATSLARAPARKRRALSNAEIKRLFAGFGKGRFGSTVADWRRSRR